MSSYQSVKDLMQRTVGSRLPNKVEQKLTAINEVLGAHGVEHIPQGNNAISPEIDYVNRGDTYTNTIMFMRGRYVVGNWGSIVERGNYN